MMKSAYCFAACFVIGCLIGCQPPEPASPVKTSPSNNQNQPADSDPTSQGQSTQKSNDETKLDNKSSANDKSATITGSEATLAPENSRIQFIGAHTDNPDDRLGGFEKFSGKATFDEDKNLQSISIEVQTDSVFTFRSSLTTHLKSPDFLDVRQFPTIKFESTNVEMGDGGKATIKGNLTLMDTTKEIEVPAEIKVDGDSFTMSTEFTINRTEFGMTKMTERVKPEVQLKFIVGEKTDTSLVEL